MKFVYFGYDFMLGSVTRLLSDGHELMGMFSFECDNIALFNHELAALAQQKSVPFILGKPQMAQIERFIDEGCECFIAAGYPYKIPAIDETKAYALNIHPSLLPKGRGIMPAPYILTDHPEASGLSIHKLISKIDGGDVLLQAALPIAERETIETLSSRILLCAPDMVSKLMSDLPHYWKKAKPQNEDEASYFPPPDEHMQLLNWNDSIHDIDKRARAFGRYGSLGCFEDQLWLIYDHDVWAEKHNYRAGEIVCKIGRTITIAAKDGFVCLKDFELAPVRAA